MRELHLMPNVSPGDPHSVHTPEGRGYMCSSLGSTLKPPNKRAVAGFLEKPPKSGDVFKYVNFSFASHVITREPAEAWGAVGAQKMFEL